MSRCHFQRTTVAGPRCLLAALLYLVSPGPLAEGLTAGSAGYFNIDWRSAAVAGASAGVQGEILTGIDLLPGSRICIAPHWTQSLSLQNDEPDQSGYLSLTLPAVNLSAVSALKSGVFGGLDSVAPVPCFEWNDSAVSDDSAIQVDIRELQLPLSVTDSYRLAAYLQGSDGSEPIMLVSNALTVSPGPRARIAASASALARPGEAIDFWIRQEDEWGNLSNPASLTLDLIVNDTYSRRIQISSAAERVEGIRFDTPGVYHLEVRSGGGGLRAVSNPVMVASTPRRLHWLNLGVTTEQSDGSASAELQIAEALGRYDSTMITDHLAVSDGAGPEEDPSGSWRGEAAGATGAYLAVDLPLDGVMNVAVAEQPSDFRSLSSASLKLTQVVSPGADHLWLGNEASRRGYRTGFVAVNHSHSRSDPSTLVYTAVWLDPGQTVADGLLSRQTYVSVGERILLQNVPQSLSFQAERQLQIDVLAASDIASVSLYKNGKLLRTKTGERLSDDSFTVSFYSDNRPLSGIESRPRNAREWIGYFSSAQAGLRVEPRGGFLFSDAANGRRVDFLTRTSGQHRSLTLSFAEYNEDTVLEIGLAEVFEDAAWLPADRLPQRLPGSLYLIPLSEMLQGAIRESQVKGYTDRISVGPVTEGLGMQTSFSFKDASEPRIGDYYYFRVELLNGAYAYTSPVFIELE